MFFNIRGNLHDISVWLRNGYQSDIDFEAILEKRLNTFYTAILVFWLNFPLNVYYIYKASNVGSTSLRNKKVNSYHAMRWLCDETLRGLNLQLKNKEIIHCNWKKSSNLIKEDLYLAYWAKVRKRFLFITLHNVNPLVLIKKYFQGLKKNTYLKNSKIYTKAMKIKS